MTILKYSLLTGVFIGIHLYAAAQVALPDGTVSTTSFINEIVKNYSAEDSFAVELNPVTISAMIPVRVNIVKNINGLAGVNTSDVYSSISSANTYFKTIGIQFIVDSVTFVNDYNYSYVTNNSNKTELITQYAIANRLNLFLVDSINMGPFRSFGLTYFPNASDSNYVFLDKTYLTGTALATMLGHFFGLLSTHETGGGAELASEKNCAASGDFICDTYADPDLFSLVDSTCKYIGTGKDNNGKYYVPSVANIMSNTLDHCKCIFTPLQYRRMYYYYVKYRQPLKH